MASGEKVYHTGTCSDCAEPVDTRHNANCYHHSGPISLTGGSVFLCCDNCQKKREKKEPVGWMPGNKHDPGNIKVEQIL